ncbi:MAG: caspase domain-containing protein [Pseudorhodobacter sp.]
MLIKSVPVISGLWHLMLGVVVMGAFPALFSPAWAEERIALVVGNSTYAEVTSLDNPVSDARLIARTLEGQGFDVTLLIDADQARMGSAIAQFGRALRVAGTDATGLFYYAGHGVQSFGLNYLLPVDVALQDAADLGLLAIEANTVLRQMFSARNRTNIVILDACRNNPFQDIPDLGDNGLAEMNAPTGTFLSYATAPGAVALDGLDGNSPFSRALAEELPTPGLPIEQLFKNVRVRVIEDTRGQQTPWDTSSLTQNFEFQPAVRISPEEQAAQNLWNSVAATRDPLQIMLFMRGYPNSSLIPQARALMAEVMATEMQPPPPGASDTNAAGDPPPAGPDETDAARQGEMIGLAQGSGLAADYQAYLDAFPTGIYAELATSELNAIREKDEAAADKPEPVAALPPAEPAAPPPPAGGNRELTFDTPLVSGGADIVGRSLADLILGSPLFPPIDGIPEELWKNQTCSNCHNWTKEALCDQGKTYLTVNNERAVIKNHPYGGGFKQNVRDWAADGCQ